MKCGKTFTTFTKTLQSGAKLVAMTSFSQYLSAGVMLLRMEPSLPPPQKKTQPPPTSSSPLSQGQNSLSRGISKRD